MRCPYCNTENTEGADFCRSCRHELAQDRDRWRGPQSLGQSTPTDVRSAHDQWDPAKRFAGPRPMSRFVPPARFPDHLVWAITVTLLCFPPTGLIALVLSLQVRSLNNKGKGQKGHRLSQLTKFFCLLSMILGIAVYVTAFFALMHYVGGFWAY